MTAEQTKEPIHHKVGCPQFPNQWDDPSGPCTCGAESAAREKTVVVSSKTPYEHHYADHAELVRRLRAEVERLREALERVEARGGAEIDRLSAENQRLRGACLLAAETLESDSAEYDDVRNIINTARAALKDTP